MSNFHPSPTHKLFTIPLAGGTSSPPNCVVSPSLHCVISVWTSLLDHLPFPQPTSLPQAMSLNYSQPVPLFPQVVSHTFP